jgi:uncharacterized membrane protein YphA (DoxX/SURF4 family)
VYWHDSEAVTLAVGLIMFASGAALLIGYLTPFAGLLAGLFILGGTFSWFPPPNVDLFEAKVTAAFATAIAVALVFLGPGAFSLDSRLFGRREIIIPSLPSQKS